MYWSQNIHNITAIILLNGSVVEVCCQRLYLAKTVILYVYVKTKNLLKIYVHYNRLRHTESLYVISKDKT